MDADTQLKNTLQIAVKNAILRMELLDKQSDRKSLFDEYKEWLDYPINVEVWALPANWNSQNKREVSL